MLGQPNTSQEMMFLSKYLNKKFYYKSIPSKCTTNLNRRRRAAIVSVSRPIYHCSGGILDVSQILVADNTTDAPFTSTITGYRSNHRRRCAMSIPPRNSSMTTFS